MSSASRRLIGAVIGVAVVTGSAMIQLGMEPRLVLVGFIVVVVLASTVLIAELGRVAAPVNWHNYGDGADVVARPDRRVQVLKARLRQPTRRRTSGAVQIERADPLDEIGDTLVAVLDDQLIAAYGIDRSVDADAAATALGADLSRFVTDEAVRRAMTRRRTLASTIAAIEDFTSSTASQ